ncbi:MAG: DUF5024 domain-containing protein [Bacteroides sp.]|nr:DUF5024 domain-containing protein [Roseburia sp.]MCM1347325.1 DUF5024 domain-containing protein [Bacteroides sp.]MCM1421805.1 DUF5024 domain-containing protein [Bacteroides sp.]
MRLWTVLTLMFWGIMLKCTAQNKIDEAVDNFSSAGTSTFTSVVERNPKTHKVNKVVKVLKLNSFHGCSAINTAFEKEKQNGSVVTQTDGKTTTVTITQENDNEIRIYSLNYMTINKRNNVVTIIIKYKKK